MNARRFRSLPVARDAYLPKHCGQSKKGRSAAPLTIIDCMSDPQLRQPWFKNRNSRAHQGSRRFVSAHEIVPHCACIVINPNSPPIASLYSIRFAETAPDRIDINSSVIMKLYSGDRHGAEKDRKYQNRIILPHKRHSGEIDLVHLDRSNRY